MAELLFRALAQTWLSSSSVEDNLLMDEAARRLRLAISAISSTGSITFSQAIADPFSVGASPAQTGVIRIPNNTAIYFRRADGAADRWLIGSDSANTTTVGSSAHTTAIEGSLVTFTGGALAIGTTPASTGSVRLPNNAAVIARNAANNADIALIYARTDDLVQLGDGNFSVGIISKVAIYNGVTTAGWGIPSIQAAARFAAQTAAKASVAAYTVGAADGTFEVSANVLVTTATTHNFTITVAYTDESNVARTLTLSFSQLTGTFLTAITNVTGAGPYEGVPLHIRAKASTSITIATTGTFTTVTYNVDGLIKQVA